jgi:hypothetical protein
MQIHPLDSSLYWFNAEPNMTQIALHDLKDLTIIKTIRLAISILGRSRAYDNMSDHPGRVLSYTSQHSVSVGSCVVLETSTTRIGWEWSLMHFNHLFSMVIR